MKSFRDLKVWQKAHQLALAVYKSTRSFPKDEIYGLTSQMRRAASSVPANIAEGCGREGDAEFGRYLQISMGSASELAYHLLLARDLNYVQGATYEDLTKHVTEVKRMLASLLRKVKADR
jgi:four helix bundle protein